MPATRRPRSAAGLLLGGLASAALAVTVAGCGGGHRNTAELRLEREDLVAVCRALQRAKRPVSAQLAASKRAWPSVVHGLPQSSSGLAAARPAIGETALKAARLPEPPPMTEAENRYLTGPGSPLAGLYRTYVGLASKGWVQIAAMQAQIEHGRAPAKRFASENVALYIEAVYDGQFDLGQIQKRLQKGYREVGGEAALGKALTQAEVRSLEDVYSEKTARLEPHATVKLGS